MRYPTRPLISLSMFLAAIVLYDGSFFFPAVGPILVGSESTSGWGAFLHCLSGMLEGRTALGRLESFVFWLPNPLFLLGLICWWTGRTTAAMVAALVALLLGFAVLLVFMELVASQVGYWLWISSFAGLLLACLARRVQKSDGHFSVPCVADSGTP